MSNQSCLGPNYNPIPPRVWSRVENQCAYSQSDYTNSSSSQIVYVPTANNFQTSADYETYYKPAYLKANILQYKANSATLTQKQRYTKIARGQWINRTKTWGTQSQTYTNPNANSYQRVNAIPLPVPTGYQNPFDCSSNTFLDGGTLIGTKTVNPCSGEIIKETSVQTCNLSTDCDVPGPPIALCWNNKNQTWYPRQRYIMTNSGTKWPVNYKFLRSANSITPQNVGNVGSY